MTNKEIKRLINFLYKKSAYINKDMDNLDDNYISLREKLYDPVYGEIELEIRKQLSLNRKYKSKDEGKLELIEELIDSLSRHKVTDEYKRDIKDESQKYVESRKENIPARHWSDVIIKELCNAYESGAGI